MPDLPQWARLRTGLNYHLRRGAWYPVVRVTQGEALIDVNQRSLTVPAELLHIVPIRPQVWSVVPRPLDAVDLPLSWGDRYAVCPNCSARAPLGERVPSMSCTRCGGERTGDDGPHLRADRDDVQQLGRHRQTALIDVDERLALREAHDWVPRPTTEVVVHTRSEPRPLGDVWHVETPAVRRAHALRIGNRAGGSQEIG